MMDTKKRLLNPYILCSIAAILLLLPGESFAQLDTWTFIGGPTILVTDSIFSMAIDPQLPDTIYAGTNNSTVFRTFDGGTNWTSLATMPGNYNVLSLAVHPVNNNTIIAATDSGGVFVSLDRGATWAQRVTGMAPDTLMKQVFLNPVNPDTLFAVGDSGIYRSLNLGVSWARRNDGLAADSVNVTTASIANVDVSTIYLGTSNGRIYQSVNFGITWSLRGTVTGAPSINAIAVDNADPDLIYIGTSNRGVWRSVDAGVTLTQISVFQQNPTNDIPVLSLAIDTSATKKVYAGTNGNGVFRFVVGDTSLQAINTGLTNGFIRALAVKPDQTHILFSGTAGQGLYRFIGNRVPVLGAIPDVQTSVGLNVSFTVTATDPDAGETLTLKYNATDVPAGASFDSLATRVFSWTPTAADTGDNVIIFRVQDLRGGVDRDTVTINVNRFPTISVSDSTVNAFEDSLITINVTGADPDGDALLYSVNNLPAGAIFDTVGVKRFTWTPSFDQAGDYVVSFVVNDRRTGITTFDVNIKVNNVNRSPFFNPAVANKTVKEGQTLAFLIKGTDLDGDQISFGTLSSSLPAGAGFDSIGTQRFSWIPTFNDSGSYTVLFSLSDGQGGSAVDSVDITVQNTNRLPVFLTLADTLFVNEGDSLKITPTAVDADSDSVSYNVANLPTGAIFNNTTGLLQWVPNFSQSGIYRIVFNALDDQGGSAFEDVVVVVNQPPVWDPVVGQFVQEGALLQFKLFASDGDGDSLTYSIANLPANATVTFSDTVTFSWIPQENQQGLYAVTFTANDRKGGIVSTIVPIQVAESTGLLPPTIIPVQDFVVNEQSRIIFQVVATDDGPQDSLTFGVIGPLPSGATYDSLGTHIFDWTPSFSQSGLYSIIFSVTDKLLNVTTDTISVTVNNVNRSPITILPTDTTFLEGESINLPLNVVDPDGDSVSVVFFEVPFGGVVDSSSGYNLVWTPSHLQAGAFKLRFRAEDGIGGTLNFNLNINITNSNRVPPVFNILFPSTGEEVGLNDFLIWEQPADPDIDDTLSYRIEIDDESTFASPEIVIDTLNNLVLIVPPAANATSHITALSKSNAEAFVLLVNTIPGINSLADNAVYYWRVKAFDNHSGESAFTTGVNSFVLNVINDPPLAPASGFAPAGGKSTNVPQPLFSWDPALDPDLSDNEQNLKYAFELSSNNFASGFEHRLETEKGQGSVLSPVIFNDNETWYYRVKTFDDEGDSSGYSAIQQIFANLTNETPGSFGLIFPPDEFGYSSRPDSLFFDWEDSFDPDPGNVFSYRLEIGTSPSFLNENIILFVDDISNQTSSISVSASVLTKASYYWRVIAVDEFGLSRISNQSRMFGLITSVHEDGPRTSIPHSFVLENSYPNPFNNEMVVRFGVPKPSDVKISIYSITGQLVYSESARRIQAGYHVFKWNGTSSSGNTVSTGVYLLVVSTNKELKSQKISIIK